LIGNGTRIDLIEPVLVDVANPNLNPNSCLEEIKGRKCLLYTQNNSHLVGKSFKTNKGGMKNQCDIKCSDVDSRETCQRQCLKCNIHVVWVS
jgi:hypothetical protein